MSEMDGSRILTIVFGRSLNVPKFAEYAFHSPKFSSTVAQHPSSTITSIATSYVQTIKDLISVTHLYRTREACGIGPLSLVAAAVVKASEKDLLVELEFPVLGDKAIGKRGKRFAADLAIPSYSSDSESDSDSSSQGEASASGADNTVVTIISPGPPQNPVVVMEYKPKLYETLDRLDISNITEVILQAFYLKEGYGREVEVMHILTDLHHFYCFKFGWRKPSYLTIEKFQHITCDLTKVEEMEHFLDFMSQQISLLGGVAQKD